jgi:Rod binding domain-containing protein
MKPFALAPVALQNAAPTQTHTANKPSEKALKSARDFESILLRHMLESMQKTAHVGSSKSQSGTAYQSMAVEALADGIERGGGLGLADLIAKSLEGEISGRSR